MSGQLSQTPIRGLWVAGGRFAKPGLYFVTRHRAYRVIALSSRWFKLDGRFW